MSVRWRINRSQVFYLWYSCSEKKKKKKKQLPEVFYKKSLLKNFAKFIVKYLCRSLFFNKVASVRTATLFKKRLQHRYFTEHPGRLLLWKVLQNHYENIVIRNLLLNALHHRCLRWSWLHDWECWLLQWFEILGIFHMNENLIFCWVLL